MSDLTNFQKFMNGLAGDARLGRYLKPIAQFSPETIILTLAMHLADAREGNHPHPAHELLERLQQ